MFNPTALSPKKKLDFIRDQILQVRAGFLNFITCPYCGHENTPVDEWVCCQKFGDASMAVIDRMDKQTAIDFMNTVQDKVN